MQKLLNFFRGWHWWILILAVAIAITAFYPYSGVSLHTQEPQTAITPAKIPVLSVKEQPNAPLRISPIKTELTDVAAPELQIELMNTSNKPIRAYAIEQYDERGQVREVTSANFVFPDSILQPGRLTMDGISCSANTDEQITLSVDFVEFADGTTWGLDKHKYGEKLAGFRAGAFAATDKLIKVLDIHGQFAVMDAIKAGATNIIPPKGRSKRWVEGFRSGTSFIREHLQRANSTLDLPKVEFELRQLNEAMSKRRPS